MKEEMNFKCWISLKRSGGAYLETGCWSRMRNNLDRQKWTPELDIALSMGKNKWRTGEVTEVATHRSQP